MTPSRQHPARLACLAMVRYLTPADGAGIAGRCER